MIFLLIFLFLLVCYKRNYQNYQNYIEYEDFENTYMCAENYEKGIGEIIKLREQRPDILLSDLGYSKIDDFDMMGQQLLEFIATYGSSTKGAEYNKPYLIYYNIPNVTYQSISVNPPENTYFNSTTYYLPMKEF